MEKQYVKEGKGDGSKAITGIVPKTVISTFLINNLMTNVTEVYIFKGWKAYWTNTITMNTQSCSNIALTLTIKMRY